MNRTRRVIWVDKTIADRDGVDLGRLRAALADANIDIVHGAAIDLGDGRVICPGCNEVQMRDRETWEPSVISSGGWRPVCRECDGSLLSTEPYVVEKRMRAYAADPGLRTRPEKASKRVRERELGLVEGSEKKRVRIHPRGRGRFGSGGY